MSRFCRYCSKSSAYRIDRQCTNRAPCRIWVHSPHGSWLHFPSPLPWYWKTKLPKSWAWRGKMQRARLWCIHSAFPCPSCKEWSLQRFCLISCALQRSYMTYSSISSGKLLLWSHILKPWTPSELKSSSCLNISCLYSLWAPWVFPGRWAVPWKWGFRQSPKTHCYQSYTATPIAILSYYFAYQHHYSSHYSTPCPIIIKSISPPRQLKI